MHDIAGGQAARSRAACKTEAMTSSLTIGVVGAGFMGSGIAESAAAAGAAGHRPRARRGSAAALAQGTRDLGGPGGLARKLDRAAGEALIERVSYTTEFDELGSVEAVIEAVTEDPRVKGKLFAQLDEQLPEARVPGLQHVVDPDRRARRLDAAPRAGARACTSSLRCRS